MANGRDAVRKKTAREVAFEAVAAFLKDQTFLAQSMDLDALPTSERHLAEQIAKGTCQRLLTLSYWLDILCARKGGLKPAQRALLFTAFYQIAFMEGIPDYAAVNETLKIAKKRFHVSFSGFANALLRRFCAERPPLPEGTDAHALSVRYSYPEELVTHFLESYPLEQVEQILPLGNEPPVIMAKVRAKEALEAAARVEGLDTPVIRLEDVSLLPELSKSPAYYVQNVTPIYLMEQLRKHSNIEPSRILDLCASPGGKLLAAHDFFPNAQLFANDVSEHKLRRIRENCAKYAIDAHLTVGRGELYPKNQRFDLIIIDAPCSNTGVLNRRPEARWRFSEENLRELSEIQSALLNHALELLAPGGEIWYLTCSILPDENEKKGFPNIKTHYAERVLPNQKGWDGGFARLLTQ